MGILDVNSDRAEHVNHAKPARSLDGMNDGGKGGHRQEMGDDVRKRQGRRNGEDRQVDN
jgi:hypothetical protein